jgi:hypothetical protein
MTIRGGFAGFGSPNPNLQDSERFETVLTGDLAGDDVENFGNRTDNSKQVIRADQPGLAIRVEGLTVSGGYSTGVPFVLRAGGMHIDSAIVQLANCKFVSNWSWAYGGGLVLKGARARVSNCSFIGNRSGYGGGLNASGGSLSIDGCVFRKNSGLPGPYPSYPTL